MKSSSARETEYDLTLRLYGIDTIDTAIEDALFEAGCDDATISATGGRVSLAFSRSASSLKEAILSAVRDVERSGIPANVVRVDVDDRQGASDVDAINRELNLKHSQGHEAAKN